MFKVIFDKTCKDIIVPFQRKAIRELFSKNANLLNISFPVKFFITVDYDENNENWMAKFNVEKSSTDKFYIAFNSVWLRGFAPRNKRQVLIVERTILHEVIHGLDILNISDSYNKRRMNYHEVWALLNKDSEKSNFFWVVMYYFSLLRDEGLALYGETLFHGPEDILSKETIQEMLVHDLEWLLVQMEENGAKSVDLDAMFSRVYAYGSYVYECMFEADRTSKQASVHIHELMNMDLSHWIWLFFNRLMPHQVHRLLSHYSSQNLKWFGRLIRSKSSSFDNPKGLLMDYFQECRINPLDGDRYILLRNHWVYNMFDVNGEWVADHYQYDLHLMVHQRLVRIWDTLDDELQRYSLAYFLTSQDQLHDELTFIGHLDDMFLLDYIEEHLC
jgi:hypothetical protein